MRRWLVNAVYCGLAVIAVPFVLWRLVRHCKRTPSLWTKLTGQVIVSSCDARRVWIHAVSVGEVLQVRPLLRELRRRDPQLDVVLSATTASGLKLARDKYPDCTIVPFPFDLSWAVAEAFTRIEPDAVVLVELELWPNFIAHAKRSNVPLIVANGRLSEKSFNGYSKLPWFIEPMFSGVRQVCAQNETYAQRFVGLGADAEKVAVTGSIKFDGLASDRARPEVDVLRKAFGLSSDSVIFMAGSTHSPEELIVLAAWQSLRESFPNLVLLIVPRHPERFDEVAQLVESAGLALTRRSAQSKPETIDAKSVRLLDTVGELSACWGLADIAFVGGTLTKRGGQNMLEPAAYGCPVLMGPNVWNFSEIASGLIDAGGAISVSDEQDLTTLLRRLLDDAALHGSMAASAVCYAKSQTGAAAKTAEAVLNLLPVPSSAEPRRTAEVA